MALLAFKNGTLENLKKLTSYTAGTLYFTTDEGAIYRGMEDGTLKRFGDFVTVDTVSDLPSTSYSGLNENALFYVKTGNILARPSINTETKAITWIQINKAGISNVQKSGSGNVVTGMSTTVAADGQMTLTYTTSSMATSADVSTLKTRVDNIEPKVTKLDGAATVEGSVKKQIADAKAALVGADATVDTIKYAVAQAKSGITKAEAAQTKANSNADDITALKTRVTTAEGTLTTLNGDAATDGSVKKQIADAKSATKSELLGNATTTNTILYAQARANKGITDAAAAQTTANEAKTAAGANATNITNLTKKVTANETNLTTLMGEDTVAGSVKNTVKNAVNKILDGAPEAYDTLKEVADWIQGDKTGAGAITSDVSNLKTRMDAAETTIKTHTSNISTNTADIKTNTAAIATLNGTGATSVTGKVNAKATELMGTGSEDTKPTIMRAEAKADAAATQATTNKTAIATLNGTGAGSVTAKVNAKATELLGDKNTAADTIKYARARADKGVTDAANAKTAADTAKTAADKAQTTANSGVSKADAAQTTANNAIAALTWGTF